MWRVRNSEQKKKKEKETRTKIKNRALSRAFNANDGSVLDFHPAILHTRLSRKRTKGREVDTSREGEKR